MYSINQIISAFWGCLKEKPLLGKKKALFDNGDLHTNEKCIVKTQSITQVITSVPWDADDLRKEPSDVERWEGFLVPVSELENHTVWAMIKHVPWVFVLGKLPGDETYEVAVCVSSVSSLKRHRLSYEYLSQTTPFVPSLTEGRPCIQGASQARKKVQSKLLRRVLDGVQSHSRRGRGFVQYLRGRLEKDFMFRIDWELFIQDILSSKPDVLERFLWHSLCFILLCLGDPTSPTSSALLEWDHETWVENLQQAQQRKTSSLEEDIGLQEVSPVLHWLFELAYSRGKDFPYHMPTTINSVSDALVVLGDLFDFEPDQPHTCGYVDRQDLQVTLQRSLLPQTNLNLKIVKKTPGDPCRCKSGACLPNGFMLLAGK